MVGENTPGYGYFLDEQDKAAGKDVPPLETMAQAMKRLRREKRWKEFCKLRADYKRKHHLEAEEAFYKALSFFPPLLLPQPDKPEVLSNRQVTEQERTWKKKHEEQLERKVRKKLDKAEKENRQYVRVWKDVDISDPDTNKRFMERNRHIIAQIASSLHSSLPR